MMTSHGEHSATTELGRWLLSSRLAQVGELVAVFVVALAAIAIGTVVTGGSSNPLLYQAVVWVANVLMLLTVWLGLRLRGQTWEHFGLRFGGVSPRGIVKTVLLSVAVFVAAVTAFIVGASVMANIVDQPQPADMSGYNYLHGNLPLTLLALAAIYIVASFGEEVIYRAFLINRIAELGAGGKLAWAVALIISSIVFGLVHFTWGVTGMVQTGCMGLALGVCYLSVKRNLWVTILAHGYMDTLLVLQMYAAEA